MIGPATGQITGTLDGNASNGGPDGDGLYQVAVTADDGEGGVVSTTFIFDANPVVANIDRPEAKPPVEPELPAGLGDGDAGLTVTEAVNGFTPLGPDTALADDLIVTSAVNGIESLGGGTALGSDHPIMEAIDNQIETDRHTGHGYSIFKADGLEAEDFHTFLGGQVDTSPHNGRCDITMRTTVHKSHLHVDLMTFGTARVSDWTVSMRDGGPIPGWVTMPARNFVIVERVADVDAVNLNITAHLRDGTVTTFPVHLHMATGEIKLLGAPYEPYKSSSLTPDLDQTQQTASATPLSDKIERLANASLNATRSLFRL